MEEEKYITGTRAIVNALVIVLIIGVFAVLLLPINPRLTKKQIQRIKCMAKVSDLANGFEKYKMTYQDYPSGDQVLVCKKLSGDNSQRIVFVSIQTDSINTNGEYLDPWGIPFGFAFPATNSFVISSAGQDKIFGTKDDIIFNSISNGFVKP